MYTIAQLIEKYIREMNGTFTGRPVRTIGASSLCTFRLVQRSPIGAVDARALTKNHVKDHVKMRLERDGICPATAQHDVDALSVVLAYAGSEWDDCDGITNAAILAAKPSLKKHGHISKSTPRTRVPTGDEDERLQAYFSQEPKKDAANVIRAMPDLILFARKSTRRLSEICRIDRALDLKLDNIGEDGQPAPLYRVRKMKDPRRKDKEKWFPLLPELAEILFRQPAKAGDSRFFPYAAKSVGAKYTKAKNALGIEGLHLHDSRRAGATDRLKVMTPHQVIRFFTGHETTVMLERIYDATNPADAHALLRETKKPEPEWAL